MKDELEREEAAEEGATGVHVEVGTEVREGRWTSIALQQAARNQARGDGTGENGGGGL